MLLKPNFALIAWTILAVFSEQAFGREQILERDDRAVFLYPRRFGQEQPAVLQKIRDACPSAVCGALAGQAVTPLLAAQPECSQQDFADSIIDASKQFDATTAAAMVAVAVEYRQVEKNTPPDFSKNPPALRNSVFCQTAPKNSQLNGLVQAQDPANDPNLFFDPATKATVIKGSQANTAPFGGKAANPAKPAEPANPATPPRANPPPPATPAAPSAANFGSCSVPQIEFGVGFDGRKETSFEPVDKKSFNHGSAQNIGVITQSICDTLTNSCKANQAAKDLCAKAQTAANGAAAKTGAQADAFNAVFGKKTNFAAIAPTDGQTPAAGNGASAGGAAAGGVAAGGAAAGGAAAGGIGNFGSCSVPQIEFGVGFDGRKETSFEPVDKKSFNHGSAQNIGIITQFICDTLTNSCKADATAKATCAKAQTAANGAAAKTGAQADAFNAVFGKKTNFAAIAPTDGQTPAAGNGASAGGVAAGGAAAGGAAAGGIGNFGSCSVPQIEFGVGFDGRKETSFEPVDKKSFNHGSAQNIGVITQSICDTLTNSCKADATAKATCAKAQAAANGAAAKTGAQADAFNAVFNIKTDFAKIAPVAN